MLTQRPNTMKKKAKPELNKLLLLAIILVICVAAEMLMSNFVWFSYVAGNTDFTDFVPENVKNEIVTKDNDTMQVREVGFPLNSVSMTVQIKNASVADHLAKAVFNVADEGNGGVLSAAFTDKIPVGTEPKRHTVYLNSRGDAYGFDVKFSAFNGDIAVTDIVINPTYEFSFNALRFAALFLGISILLLLTKTETGKTLRREFGYREAAINAAAVCISFSVVMWALCSTSETGAYYSYPLENGINMYSPYIQQFDAFLKGQLHLDVEPSEGLMSIENPYNPASRTGIECLFDRAYFEGKYYSYFGVAPLLTVYLPYYLFTGNLPSDSTVSGVFSVIIALFLPLAVVEWAEYRNKIRPWLSAVAAVAAYFATSVLLIQRGRAQFYYIACIAGMAFASAYLYFVAKYLNTSKSAAKYILLFLAGASFALGFLSRLNSIVPVGIATVTFVAIYGIKSIKSKKIGKYISEMAVLALPVAASIVFSLWYNNARFGDPLQFGTDYQLTVADTSYYKLSTVGIFPSVIHYFLQPFSFSEFFPYFGITRTVISDYGKYVYIDANFGIMVYPLMLSLFFVPYLLKGKRLSREGKAMLSVSTLSLFLTAFINFCLGGVIFRYTADIALFAAFISAAVMGELCGISEENHGGAIAKTTKKTVLAVCILTVIIGFFSMFIMTGNMVTYSPDFYEAAEEFFVFWN